MDLLTKDYTQYTVDLLRADMMKLVHILFLNNSRTLNSVAILKLQKLVTAYIEQWCMPKARRHNLHQVEFILLRLVLKMVLHIHGNMRKTKSTKVSLTKV